MFIYKSNFNHPYFSLIPLPFWLPHIKLTIFGESKVNSNELGKQMFLLHTRNSNILNSTSASFDSPIIIYLNSGKFKTCPIFKFK